MIISSNELNVLYGPQSFSRSVCIKIYILHLFWNFYREQSAVSHSSTVLSVMHAKSVEINGAIAYAVSGQLQYSLFSFCFKFFNQNT